MLTRFTSFPINSSTQNVAFSQPKINPENVSPGTPDLSVSQPKKGSEKFIECAHIAFKLPKIEGLHYTSREITRLKVDGHSRQYRTTDCINVIRTHMPASHVNKNKKIQQIKTTMIQQIRHLKKFNREVRVNPGLLRARSSLFSNYINDNFIKSEQGIEVKYFNFPANQIEVLKKPKDNETKSSCRNTDREIRSLMWDLHISFMVGSRSRTLISDNISRWLVYLFLDIRGIYYGEF